MAAKSNLVLITAMIRPKMDFTVFTPQQRWEQLLNTIDTVKAKIPNSILALVEGGTMTPEEQAILQTHVDFVLMVDVTALFKSPGETTLIHSYLHSSHFQLHSPHIANFVKISGRYWLDDRFEWTRFAPESTVATFFDSSISWSTRPFYLTRFYKVPNHKLERYIAGFDACVAQPIFNRNFPDVEHNMVIFGMFDPNNVQPLPYLGCSGLITGTGELVRD